MIIAGEPSGDLHGGALIKELRALAPEVEIFGIGGDRMKAGGMTLIYHIKEMAFLGFAEIIKHIPFIRKVQSRLIDIIKEKNISTLVLIDYPGFNLNFAKKAKKLGVEIVYYISPQIWAWGKGRLSKINDLVKKMIVVFPFEKKIYESENIDAEYVGHPLVERIEEYGFLTREELYSKYELDREKEILLLLPGSRKQEITNIFPHIIATAQKIASKFNMQIVVSRPDHIDESIYRDTGGRRQFKVAAGNVYDLMRHSKFGIIKSGTSTLEAGLLELPFVIVYSTGLLTYFIGKRLIKLSNIGMVNIVAGEKLIDEFIQNDLKGSGLYDRCEQILSSPREYESIRMRLKEIKQKLGDSGASRRAAKIISDIMNENKRIL